MFGFKQRRRRRIRERPFPAEWIEILERNMPLYRRLPAEDREELHGHIQVFLAEKNIEGCDGFEITDEVRVTIAGQACLLLLHQPHEHYYPLLYSVLVYPTSFWVRKSDHLAGDVTIEGDDVHAGESWHQGAVVLAWDEVVIGGAHHNDGYNVVYHEFAHQLDRENPDVDGMPLLLSREMAERWVEVMSKEYERLLRDLDFGRPTVLDDYAADDPAEFFAVATECFFEKPLRLKRRHPELYGLLRDYYRQDPAELYRGAGGPLPGPGVE